MKNGLPGFLVVPMILKVVSFNIFFLICCYIISMPILRTTPMAFISVCICSFLGMTGLFCPCILFGRNVESLNEEIPANTACICHGLCVEGGMVLAAVIAFVPGIDPGTSCLITEGLLFAWWMCGIYTGMARQSLQRKYHLKVLHRSLFSSN